VPEGIPDPDQLKSCALERSSSLVYCQTALNYYNGTETFLARLFTLEYSYWLATFY